MIAVLIVAAAVMTALYRHRTQIQYAYYGNIGLITQTDEEWIEQWMTCSRCGYERICGICENCMNS